MAIFSGRQGLGRACARYIHGQAIWREHARYGIPTGRLRWGSSTQAWRLGARARTRAACHTNVHARNASDDVRVLLSCIGIAPTRTLRAHSAKA